MGVRRRLVPNSLYCLCGRKATLEEDKELTMDVPGKLDLPSRQFMEETSCSDTRTTLAGKRFENNIVCIQNRMNPAGNETLKGHYLAMVSFVSRFGLAVRR